MTLSREKKAMFEFGQGDNMGKYVKDKELQEVNGKLLRDEYLASEIAMLILVIENFMGKVNDVSFAVWLIIFFLFKDLTVSIILINNIK